MTSLVQSIWWAGPYSVRQFLTDSYIVKLKLCSYLTSLLRQWALTYATSPRFFLSTYKIIIKISHCIILQHIFPWGFLLYVKEKCYHCSIWLSHWNYEGILITMFHLQSPNASNPLKIYKQNRYPRHLPLFAHYLDQALQPATEM